MKILLRTIFTLVVLALVATAAFVYFGVYNVAATQQHSAPLYHFLHYTMRRSVSMRAADVQVPNLDDPRRVRNGFMLYRQHCLQCHGAPGVAPDPLGFGTRPEPANLVEAGRKWPAADIYWVIKHGLKMTAMPAWQYHVSEQELWDLTAFVKRLPALSPQEYMRWNNAPPHDNDITAPVISADSEPGDPQAGRHALEQYLCVTCHQIPGVAGANGSVGPPLRGIATRKYIAGVLPNTPDNMMRWLRNPQLIDPRSAMPDLRIREKDIRDITAYLYTLK